MKEIDSKKSAVEGNSTNTPDKLEKTIDNANLIIAKHFYQGDAKSPITLKDFENYKRFWDWDSIGQPIVWNSDVMFQGSRIWEGDVDLTRLNVLKKLSESYPNYSITIIGEYGLPHLIIKRGIVFNRDVNVNPELTTNNW